MWVNVVSMPWRLAGGEHISTVFPKRLVEEKGSPHLLPRGNSPSPLKKPGSWAEDDKPKPKELKCKRNFRPYIKN